MNRRKSVFAGRRRLAGLLAAAVSVSLGVFGTSAGRLAADEQPAAAPQSDQALQAQIAARIAELGDEQFAVRERATAELVRLGPPVRSQVLHTLAATSDPEVQARCRRILEVVFEVDFRRRLEAFAADEEGKLQHGLPGWERFRELVGESAADRELFVEMQRAEAALMECAQGDPAKVGELLDARCAWLQVQMSGQAGPVRRGPSLGTVAAMLFAASAQGAKVTEQGAAYLYGFCHQPVVRAALTGGPRVDGLKRLLGAWIASVKDTGMVHQSIYLAMMYELPEGLPIALELLAKESLPLHLRQQALLAVGRLGNRQHLQAVLPYLKDEALLSITQDGQDPKQRIRTEVRDLALAVAVKLTEQNHAHYGFQRLRTNPYLLYDVNSLGFLTQSQRDAALAAWERWWQQHRPDPPADPVRQKPRGNAQKSS